MNLSQKILYCRKKKGLSQESLAALLDVSRQAVSKWETGESEPEVGKLKTLAEVFGVSADWLLDSSESEETAEKSDSFSQATGFIGRMIRRYGWVGGLYMAIAGALFIAMGAVARAATTSMTRGMDPFFQREGMTGPMEIMTAFIMILGGAFVVSGAGIIIFLKARKGKGK